MGLLFDIPAHHTPHSTDVPGLEDAKPWVKCGEGQTRTAARVEGARTGSQSQHCEGVRQRFFSLPECEP